MGLQVNFTLATIPNTIGVQSQYVCSLSKQGITMYLPPMGESEENRLRAEMESWSNEKLIAASKKSPGVAIGIAAEQLLSERSRKEKAAQHIDIMTQLRKPEWKTWSFWFSLIAAITGFISATPIIYQNSTKTMQDTSPKVSTPAKSASAQK